MPASSRSAPRRRAPCSRRPRPRRRMRRGDEQDLARPVVRAARARARRPADRAVRRRAACPSGAASVAACCCGGRLRLPRRRGRARGLLRARERRSPAAGRWPQRAAASSTGSSSAAERSRCARWPAARRLIASSPCAMSRSWSPSLDAVGRRDDGRVGRRHRLRRGRRLSAASARRRAEVAFVLVDAEGARRVVGRGHRRPFGRQADRRAREREHAGARDERVAHEPQRRCPHGHHVPPFRSLTVRWSATRVSIRAGGGHRPSGGPPSRLPPSASSSASLPGSRGSTHRHAGRPTSPGPRPGARRSRGPSAPASGPGTSRPG